MLRRITTHSPFIAEHNKLSLDVLALAFEPGETVDWSVDNSLGIGAAVEAIVTLLRVRQARLSICASLSNLATSQEKSYMSRCQSHPLSIRFRP